MGKADVGALLRSLITTTPISGPVLPLFGDLVKALDTTPADRLHLAAFADPAALRNVPPEALYALPVPARAAIWSAAPARFSTDMSYTLQLTERELLALQRPHNLCLRLGSHPQGPGAPSPPSGKRRLAIARELMLCVRGDDARYGLLCRMITDRFTRSRDAKWSQLRHDLYIAHADKGRPNQGLPRDPCGQLIIDCEKLVSGVPSAPAAVLRTVRNILALAAAKGADAGAGGGAAAGGPGADIRLTDLRKHLGEAIRDTTDFARARGGAAVLFISEAKGSFRGNAAGWEDYLRRIAPGAPMDYDTMRRTRLGRYGSWEEALGDARRVADNSRRYNGAAHPFTAEAETLFSHFEAQVERARLQAAGISAAGGGGGRGGAALSGHSLGAASASDVLCVLSDPHVLRAAAQIVVRDALLPATRAGVAVHEPLPAPTGAPPTAASSSSAAGAAAGTAAATAAAAGGRTASAAAVPEAALCCLFILALSDCAFARVRQGAALVMAGGGPLPGGHTGAASARGRGGSAARAHLAYQRPELTHDHLQETLGPAPPPATAAAGGAKAAQPPPVLASALPPHLTLACRCLQNVAMQTAAEDAAGAAAGSAGGSAAASGSGGSAAAAAPSAEGSGSAAGSAGARAADAGALSDFDADCDAAVAAARSGALSTLYRVLRRGKHLHSRSVSALVAAYAGFHLRSPLTRRHSGLLQALCAVAAAPGGACDVSLPATVVPCMFSALTAAHGRQEAAGAEGAAAGSSDPDAPLPSADLARTFIDRMLLPWALRASERPDARGPVHDLLVRMLQQLTVRGVLRPEQAAAHVMRALASLAGTEAAAAAAAAAVARIAAAGAAGLPMSAAAAGLTPGSASAGLGVGGGSGMLSGPTPDMFAALSYSPATPSGVAAPAASAGRTAAGAAPDAGSAARSSGGASAMAVDGAAPAAAAPAAAAPALSAHGAAAVHGGRSGGPLEGTLTAVSSSTPYGPQLSAYLTEGLLSPLALVFTRPDFAVVALSYARFIVSHLARHIDFAALGLSPAFVAALGREGAPGAGALGGLQLLLPGGAAPFDAAALTQLTATAAAGASGGGATGILLSASPATAGFGAMGMVPGSSGPLGSGGTPTPM